MTRHQNFKSVVSYYLCRIEKLFHLKTKASHFPSVSLLNVRRETSNMFVRHGDLRADVISCFLFKRSEWKFNINCSTLN